MRADYVERARRGALVAVRVASVITGRRKVLRKPHREGMQNKTLSITVAAAMAGLLTAGQPAAHAAMVLVDGKVQVAKTDVARPKGGMTMAAVESRFGTPRERHPTVGTPPITRWDYDSFSVFFEKDRVIDAVVPGSAAASATVPVSAAAKDGDSSSAATASPTQAPASDAPQAPSNAAPAAASPGLINIDSGTVTLSDPTEAPPTAAPAAQSPGSATQSRTPAAAPAAAPADTAAPH